MFFVIIGTENGRVQALFTITDTGCIDTGCIDSSTLTTRGKRLLGALTIREDIHTRAPQPVRCRLFFDHLSEDTSRPNERRTVERYFYDP